MCLDFASRASVKCVSYLDNSECLYLLLNCSHQKLLMHYSCIQAWLLNVENYSDGEVMVLGWAVKRACGMHVFIKKQLYQLIA